MHTLKFGLVVAVCTIPLLVEVAQAIANFGRMLAHVL